MFVIFQLVCICLLLWFAANVLRYITFTVQKVKPNALGHWFFRLSDEWLKQEGRKVK